MGVSKLGFGFSIKERPINLNFDFRVNCREEFNYLRYSSSFPETSVGVSYLNSSPISVEENILVRDLTEETPENSPRKFFERIETEQSIEVETGSFLLTDIFKLTSTGEELALYYRHDLSEFTNISEVEILDGNLNPINKDLYSYYDETSTLGSEARYIYTNLQNEYSRVSNEYTIYYYRFRDLTTGRLILGLLDSKPFYNTVNFTPPPTERAYRIDPGFNTSDVQIWFNSRLYSPTGNPAQQKFSIKSAGSDRVEVLKPVSQPPTSRWYPRISFNEFYRNEGGQRLYYYIPEYYAQFFSPVPPYKSVIEQQATILEDRLLQVSPTPIANLGITGFYIYVVLKDEIGRSVKAFTNDPTATFYITKDRVLTDTYYEKDIIKSVDSSGGFILLEKPIDTSLTAYVSYRYEEKFLTYRDINVNSTINPDVLDTKIVMYIVPEKSAANKLTQSIFHIQVNEAGNIIDASQSAEYIAHIGKNAAASFDTIKDETLLTFDAYTGYELEILTGMNAGRKVPVASYNPVTKVVTLSVAMQDPIAEGVQYRINKKYESYSYFDEAENSTYNYMGWKDNYTSSPNYYVILAEMFAVQTLSPRDIEMLDIRIRGGGLRKDEVQNALEIQDEVQWYWDVGYWDGQPYPGMGAIIVEIPRGVLEESGGAFTRPQVEDIVRTHMAEGCHPIIRYYDRSTLITVVDPGNSKVYLEWQDVEAGFYNVYFGTGPNSMQLYRSVSGAILEIEVEGLENGKTYYFKVEAVVSGVAQLPSKTIIAIPFNPATVAPGAIYGETKYIEGTYNNG
jgi:hypothetical protein